MIGAAGAGSGKHGVRRGIPDKPTVPGTASVMVSVEVSATRVKVMLPSLGAEAKSALYTKNRMRLPGAKRADCGPAA